MQWNCSTIILYLKIHIIVLRLSKGKLIYSTLHFKFLMDTSIYTGTRDCHMLVFWIPSWHKTSVLSLQIIFYNGDFKMSFTCTSWRSTTLIVDSLFKDRVSSILGRVAWTVTPSISTKAQSSTKLPQWCIIACCLSCQVSSTAGTTYWCWWRCKVQRDIAATFKKRRRCSTWDGRLPDTKIAADSRRFPTGSWWREGWLSHWYTVPQSVHIVWIWTNVPTTSASLGPAHSRQTIPEGYHGTRYIWALCGNSRVVCCLSGSFRSL